MSASEICVLIVEDDEDLRVTLGEFISKMGVKVSTAGTVADAKQALGSQPGHFDLVLTDLKLPDGDGMEVLSEAHACSTETLVSIVTGHGSMETAIGAIRLGAYDYLTKPFTLDEIGIQVRNMIERASLSKENARLSIRLQELYEKVNRLQNERTEIVQFQDEIRRALQDNNHKLDRLLASPANQAGRGQSMVIHPDKALVSNLFRDMEHLDSLRSAKDMSAKEIEDHKRGLIQEFVDKL